MGLVPGWEFLLERVPRLKNRFLSLVHQRHVLEWVLEFLESEDILVLVLVPQICVLPLHAAVEEVCPVRLSLLVT